MTENIISITEIVPGVRLKQPLHFCPMISGDPPCCWIAYPVLDISVSGSNWEQMEIALQEQLSMLWHEYALEEDAKLSQAALELKHALLDLVEPKN